jgi:ubiquinone biosynthesis protein
MDFGITGRLAESQRLAFIRVLMGGVTNDIRTQLSALSDIGALPKDTDIEAVIKDLGLDRPPMDPTKMSAQELINEMREVVSKLVAYGARMPKELMLFIKNLLFLDGAIATLAPDLDLIKETFHVATYFATKHGERLATETGTTGEPFEIDLDGFKASFGLDSSTESLTYADLQERRKVIRKRFEEHQRKVGRRGLLRRR